MLNVLEKHPQFFSHRKLSLMSKKQPLAKITAVNVKTIVCIIESFLENFQCKNPHSNEGSLVLHAASDVPGTMLGESQAKGLRKISLESNKVGRRISGFQKTLSTY
jgi:hypothetical protein